MPEKTPRAPLPALAILLSPFTWQYGRPDLFDSYRCLSVAELLSISVRIMSSPVLALLTSLLRRRPATAAATAC